MFRYRYLILIFAIAFTVDGQIQSLKVGNVLPGQVDMGAFNLSDNSKIEISGLAASFDQWENYLNYYAWILNSNSREVVWRSSTCEEYEKEDGEFEVERNLDLEQGNYEVYFASGHDFEEFEFRDLNSLMGSIFKKKSEHFTEYRDKFFISVTGNNNFKIVDAEELVDQRNNSSIVSITRVGDYENIQRKFSLSGDTKINIYGIGEGISKQFYDFGYIYDVSKNRRIWMFNKNDSDYAGGGKKNRSVSATINLSKGSYYVTYVSDDSHSYDEWNVLPPEDPQYWGITIFPASENDAKNVISFREEDVHKPIIDISKVHDNETRSQGFKLTKKVKLRVFSVGEGLQEMADYGWIVNADTRETVWKMRKRNTEYAGGSKKNRMTDEKITLNEGNYIAYYVTDDSHSFMNWNDSPPYHAEDWGIKIWTENKDDNKYVEYFDADNYKNENLLVEIVQTGDEERIKKTFKLETDSNIRIIAIGEGGSGEMNDYGWIENTSGEIVWEMKYNRTYHAGGAKKNRMFNEVISLPSGEYKVYFQTDDSHSYPDWNSTPPDEKERYGITIILEK